MIRISAIQFTPLWRNKPGNLAAIRRLLGGLESDIILLPELCTTGYSFLSKEEAIQEAEDLSGESVTLIKELDCDMKTMIIAGFAEKDKDNDEVYNSALLALPDGNVKIYRKTHLFFKEKLCFAPGNTGFFVVDHPLVDCRVGVMICNDWRYPEVARTLGLLGADIIVCPSNLVSELWSLAMPARAIENKVYLAVANRTGAEERILEDNKDYNLDANKDEKKDDNNGENQDYKQKQLLSFNGGSVIYSFDGSVLAKAGNDEEAVITAAIEPLNTRDKSFNAYNDLFKDRRPDYYQL
jgi:predicted amidohydrolase